MGVRRTVSRRELRSFRALYQAHYGFVWATVRRHGVRAEAIEDAVQDAFLTAFRRWDDVPDDRSRAWLYGIARRVSSNARRTQHRRDRKHEALRVGEPAVHDERGRLEASAVLERFVRGLDADDRELFVLGVVEGLTGAELSAALGARPSTLYGRLDALRRRFRTEAGERGPAAVRRAKRGRPLAKAAGWAALTPQLGGSAALGASLMGLKVAAAVGLVATTLGLWAAGPSDPDAAPAEPVASSERPAVSRTTASTPGAPSAAPGAPIPSVVSSGVSPPAARHLAARTFAAKRPSSAPVSAPSPRPDPLLAETSSVGRIRDAMSSGDMALALNLVDAYAKKYPEGVLSDAVGALRVQALCGLGESGKAEDEAERIREARPGSPVARRLRGTCPHKSGRTSVISAPDGHGQQ